MATARLTRVLAALLLAAGAASVAAPAQADPVLYPCIGAPADEPAGGLYPEPRVFVEGQAQWVPGPGQVSNPDTDNGHVHVGACIPEREVLNAAVTPNLTANVRVVTFHQPGTVTYASMVFKTTASEVTVQKAQINGLSCPTAECVRWVAFSWPLSAFDRAGLQEVRFRVFVNEPNGKQQNTSLNWQVTVENGKTRSNVTRMPYLRGKGWYTHSLYCEGSYLSVPVPDAPVAGVWRPTVMMDTHSSDASLPVTHYTAAVDPHGHESPPDPGTVVLDADGRLPATALAVDTTALANGPHRLFLRSGCRDDSLGSTNWGVLAVSFVVANP